VGAAGVVIERDDRATPRGVTGHGRILGGGQSADAYDMVRPDPEGDGPNLAIRRALHLAQLEPAHVSLVAGHGTATAANDAMETTLYNGEYAGVPVMATKGIHGHAISASAVLELIIALAFLQGQPVAPECWHPDHPSDLRSPSNATVALKNAFGVGGLNTSLVIASPSPRVEASPVRARRDVLATRAFTASGSSWFGEERFGLTRREWATSDLLTKLVYAATTRVLPEDAERRDDIGLMYATAHGPILSWIVATDAMRYGKPLNPRLIPRLSYTAAPAWTAQKLGLRGPLAMYYGGDTGTSAALEHARMLLELEGADAMVVVAADEYTGPDADDLGIVELAQVDPRDALFAPLHRAIGHARAVPTVTAVLLRRAGSMLPPSDDALLLEDTVVTLDAIAARLAAR
jgi:3-oxoacyl-(acyl-carrier-protein) synthase